MAINIVTRRSVSTPLRTSLVNMRLLAPELQRKTLFPLLAAISNTQSIHAVPCLHAPRRRAPPATPARDSPTTLMPIAQVSRRSPVGLESRGDGRGTMLAESFELCLEILDRFVQHLWILDLSHTRVNITCAFGSIPGWDTVFGRRLDWRAQ